MSPVCNMAFKVHKQLSEQMPQNTQLHERIQRGGQGVRTPLKNHKNKGFLSNTGPDHLKNHIATKPAFNVGSSSASQLAGLR